jgi:glutamine synthetase
VSAQRRPSSRGAQRSKARRADAHASTNGSGPAGTHEAALTIDALEHAVAAGSIDTVVLALVDMDGRLVGKRLTARHFLEDVTRHGAEACEYLLATDVEMSPQAGYSLAGWSRGFADFALRPDLSSLRVLPWSPGAAMVLADALEEDGSPIPVSPRFILRRQLERLAEKGLAANVATELEFIVFRTTYQEAWQSGYRNLQPGTRYSVDYALQGTAAIEPLIRRIRNAMSGAGMVVESSKGECNLGQHEINFRYADPMRIADDHAVYKSGAKEIAEQEGMAITFMAKFDQREGSSCHIHISLAGTDGSNAFATRPELFQSFLAGQLACLREMTLMFAPQVNSYKRYVPGLFAPTTVAWGHDNRTCALRIIGHGDGLRIENRLPGADVNPHLAIAAMIAAGLHGIEQGLVLEPPLEGSAYESGRQHVPHTLEQARDLFAGSSVARQAFGDGVVEHYLNHADIELRAFQGTVTEWERIRGFERL